MAKKKLNSRRPKDGPRFGPVTSYTPEHCQKAIAIMSEGYSLSGLAGQFNLSRAQLYNWATKYPEFAEALDIGRAKSAEFWEKEAKRLVKGGEGNAAICIFALKNRVAADWRERQDAVTPTEQNYNLNLLTDEEVRQLERLAVKIEGAPALSDQGRTLKEVNGPSSGESGGDTPKLSKAR